MAERTLRCPRCGSTHIIRLPNGELVCADCGYVLEEFEIDMGRPERFFSPEDYEERVHTGGPTSPLKADYGITTQISGTRDYSGKALEPVRKREISRIMRWHRIASTSPLERNVSQALREIEKLAERLGLPKHVRETAAMYYRRAAQRRLVRGRSIEAVVAAVLYAAARKHRTPRTLDEIAKATGIPKTVIGRIYRQINQALKLNIGLQTPMDFVNLFANKLGLSPKTKRVAEDILRKLDDMGLTSGRSPTGMAAAAIYLACQLTGEPRTQKQVAKVSGVTEVTIRNRYKEIVEKLKITI
ncbi:MAG: transcription initiation factor IIB [Thermoplasmata archaeon]|nr:transcription initiation factor IIB [Thermoplasmata archaeon]